MKCRTRGGRGEKSNFKSMGRNKLLKKEEVLEIVKGLPEQFSIDDLIDKIILLQKIETGLKQSDDNQVIPDHNLKIKTP